MFMSFARYRASIAALALCAFAAGSAVAQTANRPPTLTGTVTPTGVVGTWYSFKPYARDPDGNTLTFRIQNKPAWASFNTTNGRLNGWPVAGTYSNVIISVSDGTVSRSLAAATIRITGTTPPPPPPPSTGTLSERYPGDVGIAGDPAVVFHDPYEDASPSNLGNRYQTITNLAGVSLVSDKHAKSRGAKSVRLSAGASSEATALFRNFGTGWDEVYLRYYTKYVGTARHHTGMWFGGYNPAINWPWSRAGQKPNGDERFSFGLEPNYGDSMDLYTYWMKMHSYKTNPGPGDYFGNTMIQKNGFRVRQDQWTCYEVHLKLNPNPANGQDSVLEVWENDQLVRRFDNTGPYGWWGSDRFCPADTDLAYCNDYAPANRSQVKLDTQWRNNTALKFNHIWPQNFNTTGV